MSGCVAGASGNWFVTGATGTGCVGGNVGTGCVAGGIPASTGTSVVRWMRPVVRAASSALTCGVKEARACGGGGRNDEE